jgi:hypothetical protein
LAWFGTTEFAVWPAVQRWHSRRGKGWNQSMKTCWSRVRRLPSSYFEPLVKVSAGNDFYKKRKVSRRSTTFHEHRLGVRQEHGAVEKLCWLFGIYSW